MQGWDTGSVHPSPASAGSSSSSSFGRRRRSTGSRPATGGGGGGGPTPALFWAAGLGHPAVDALLAQQGDALPAAVLAAPDPAADGMTLAHHCAHAGLVRAARPPSLFRSSSDLPRGL